MAYSGVQAWETRKENPQTLVMVIMMLGREKRDILGPQWLKYLVHLLLCSLWLQLFSCPPIISSQTVSYRSQGFCFLFLFCALPVPTVFTKYSVPV